MNKQAYLKMMSRGLSKRASTTQAQLLYKVAMMHKQQGITQWWGTNNNRIRQLWDVIWNWLRKTWDDKYKYHYQEAKDAFGQDQENYGGLSLDQRAMIRESMANADKRNTSKGGQTPAAAKTPTGTPAAKTPSKPPEVKPNAGSGTPAKKPQEKKTVSNTGSIISPVMQSMIQIIKSPTAKRNIGTLVNNIKMRKSNPKQAAPAKTA